jgi:integrase
MALSDTFIRQIKPSKPSGDKHYDGGGLYLFVKGGGRYWRLDYRYLNKRKTMSLGTYPEVSLAKARKRRDDARVLLADDIDPAQARRNDREARLIAASNTFELVARLWLEKEGRRRSPSTQDKVLGWLEHDVFPYIGKRAVSELKPRDVLLMVQKVEARGAFDSAHRIKQMCGQVFRFAVALDLAPRDVTVDLRGALTIIPRTNHAAITEPKEVAVLMRAIHGYSGSPAAVAALKLAPLVFVRPGELRAAEWDEIDLDDALWRIPGAKMKMKIDHLVPLSTQAVEILRKLYPVTGHGKYVFPSLRTHEACMSENTINAALRGLGYGKEVMTGHGFRAMARTILDEVLGERVDLIEHQLAHAVKDVNGRAYNRTTHIVARREMMQRWSDYLDKLRLGAAVIPMRDT